jgi:hypothetical protein
MAARHTFLAAAVVFASAGAAYADPFRIDQSATGTSSVSASINQCCAFVSQLFTAGITADLVGVSVDITAEGDHGFPLRLAITGTTLDTFGRTVPDLDAVLADAVVASGSVSLAELVLLSHAVRQFAGQQYAIVANYMGAPPPAFPGPMLGGWGRTTEDYVGGYAMSLRAVDSPWILLLAGDNRFITYVSEQAQVPEPGTWLLLTSGLTGLAMRCRSQYQARRTLRSASGAVATPEPS